MAAAESTAAVQQATSVQQAAAAQAQAAQAKIILDFLNKGNIPCKTLADLDGMLVPRELFFQPETYKQLKEQQIPELKTIFSSSYLTSLQTTAETAQRWPLLNLIRQVLRSSNFKLTPKRVADGYTLDGKKKYKRLFIIEKMKII